MSSDDDTSVRVAVRIRPLSAKEKIGACRVCTYVTPGDTQLSIGKDKKFTYDYVFDVMTQQIQIYETCVKKLVNGCFDGYNATILAYGQTGSGKTYTMGTGFDISRSQEEFGVLPRAVKQFFEGIEERKTKASEEGLPEPEFSIHCQFLELYNEEIIDLLDTSRRGQGNAKIQIQQDSSGNICAGGMTTKAVQSAEELMKCLQEGALNRTTASTNMNAQSSRSHAIFSIHMKQTRTVRKLTAESPVSEDGDRKENGVVNGDEPLEYEMLSAKFHFTDLAGSERLKRTGATGKCAKEGISINCGLLALGNVISALGDPEKAGGFVPYRDSKLTRLLQDSLGGNSRTLMIACVSPSDSDFMETVSSLTYANRARNIKNKVVLNQDKASQQIQALRQQIMALQLENMEYKTGKRVAGEGGFNDMYQENTMLKEENEHLRMRVKAMQERSDTQTDELTKLKTQLACGNVKADGDNEGEGMESIIEDYIKGNESLRSKLLESEAMCANLRLRSTSLSCASMSPFASRVTPTPFPMVGTSIFESPSASTEVPLLDLAKREIEGLRQKKTELENPTLIKKENKENVAEVNGDGGFDNIEEDGSEESDEETELNLSDSDDEDEEQGNAQNDLAALTFEIDLKQKLIDEIEAQNRRMDAVRHQYESKLQQLETRIKCTEDERDQILSNFEKKAPKRSGEEKKILKQYEQKLENMKKEVNKLKGVRKVHDQALKDQTKYQQQLKKLKTEMDQMKTTKVRLMKEMKEQQKKGQQQDSQRRKEITQLRKESRKKESQLRTLESKYQAKDRMVLRKRDEIEMLRKQMAVKLGGDRRKQQQALRQLQDDKNTKPTGGKNRSRTLSSKYSSKMAKAKWQKIEKKISNVVLQRETIAHMEKQMDRLMKQRENAQKDIQRAERRKCRLKANGNQVPADLKSELVNLRENVEFTNYQIEEIQSEILQVTENMEADSYMSTLLDTCSSNEFRYIVDHILTVHINKYAMALVSQNKIVELEAKLEGELETSKQAQELMRYIVEEQPQLGPEITELIKTSGFDDDTDSDSSPERPPSVNGFATSLEIPKDTKVKARRKTTTPMELLHGIPRDALHEPANKVLSPIMANGTSTTNGHLNETYVIETTNFPDATSTPGGKDLLKMPRPNFDFDKPTPPGSLHLKSTVTVDSPARSPECAGAKPKVTTATENPVQTALSNDEFALPTTPPPARHRPGSGLTSDVFARLTRFSLASPQVNSQESVHYYTSRGKMKECPSKATTPRASHLECMQIAEGHNKPVLCLHATGHLLFSGSKDRSVKIWNLVTGKEFETLDGHPNNVNVVHRCPTTGLVYTVSLCYIKVWDIRSKTKCIKVISSSGQTLSPTSFLGTMGRTNHMPENEAQILDLAMSSDSKFLYSAAGNTVRIWDLNTYSVVGKLVGHTGPVMTLAVPNLKNDTVVTGSKDHYVKAFQIPKSQGTISPTFTFDPPHMDGVESLVMSTSHNALFSGSRDKSIKKWQMDSRNLLKSEYQAHASWVCTMNIVNFGSKEMLVSGGRDGTMKVWDIENLVAVDDVLAHGGPINHIASNNNMLYTASNNDRVVKLWKWTS